MHPLTGSSPCLGDGQAEVPVPHLQVPAREWGHQVKRHWHLQSAMEASPQSLGGVTPPHPQLWRQQ